MSEEKQAAIPPAHAAVESFLNSTEVRRVTGPISTLLLGAVIYLGSMIQGIQTQLSEATTERALMNARISVLEEQVQEMKQDRTRGALRDEADSQR